LTDLSFAEALYENGFKDLVSVIPPGAQLAPSSSISEASRGKAPGRRQPSGLFSGYNWRNHSPTADEVIQWSIDGANIGIRADRFPGVDIDCTDENIASIIQRAAFAKLGHAPVRVGRAPKRLLMYHTLEPFSRMRLWVKLSNGDQHLVEILGAGQQYLIHGTHPSTGKPYEWDCLLEENVPDDLSAITREQADEFLDELKQQLEALSIGTVVREGDGRRSQSVRRADQESLVAPSIEVLSEAVALIPNDDSTAPQRDDYIKFGAAIRAAAGDEDEDGFDIFATWCAKHEADGRVAGNPETWRGDWQRITPPFAVGWPWLAELARGFGFNDAALDFDVVDGKELNEIEKMNSEFALVRSVANMVLHTPSHGPVEQVPHRHWLTVNANRRMLVPSGKGAVRDVPATKHWLEHPERRTYNRLVIDPDSPPNTGIAAKFGSGEDFNLWPGFSLKPSPEGSCDLFLAHVKDNVCGGNADIVRWVMMWIASMFQKPARLPGTALFLKGVQGCGKSTVGEVLAHILGDRLAVAVSSTLELTGRFNSILENRVLVQAEEAFFAGDPSIKGKLKSLITSPNINIERKGIEPIALQNLMHLLCTSNEDYGVPADAKGERRWMVLDVSPKHANDHEYFGALRKQMFDEGGCARLLHHLLYELPIDWRLIGRPLATDALRDQQLLSLPSDQQWLYTQLLDGALPGDTTGTGVCLTSDLFRNFEAYMQRHQARRSDQTTFGKMIAPLAEKKQRRGSQGKRYYYEFKSLSECRAIFARGLATAPEWGEHSDWQAEFEIAA
jgi:hypothetical protein